MGILERKKGLIVGVANKHSIAWGIAKACVKQGAELAFSYLEPFESRVRKLAEELGSDQVFELDVTNDEHLKNAPAEIEKRFGKIDFLVHAVAMAKKEELAGRFVDTTRDGFKLALDVSAWSLIGLTKALMPVMVDDASILTISYLGAERVIPNYNVMGVAKAALESSVKYLANDLGPEEGIRVNAISSGPVKTLSASGIGDFGQVLKWQESTSPLRGNLTLDQLGPTATFLLSDLSAAITGETVHVDMGYHIMGSASLGAIKRLKDLEK